ncbi:porin family protein [Namhaeicola litoreus]|uniref:Porin family protein n=1 Tax=Namhaeicola litoreus TaxID=1052145 RepID=A0ABW3XWX9_9FLAO
MKWFKLLGLFVFLEFTFLTLCNAQAGLLVLIFGDKVASENFHLSLDAGLTISDLPGLDQGSSGAGFYFGLGTYIKLTDKWSLAPEFKPVSPLKIRGLNDVFMGIEIQDPDAYIKINYIDVPVLLQYQMSRRFSIAAGPQISFLNSSKLVTTGKLSTGESVEIKENLKPIMNDYHFQIPLQLSYALSTMRGGKGLDIKLRYNFGLGDVFSNNELYSSNTSVWQIFVSFPFINSSETKE